MHDRTNAGVTPKKIDELLAQGKLDEAQKCLVLTPAPCSHHLSLVVEKSDSRLVYYMAGYVATKCVLKRDCSSCRDLLNQSEAAENRLPSGFTEQCDRDGLLYPSKKLHTSISTVEDLFTGCFSVNKLQRNGISDVVALVSNNFLPCNIVGCTFHSEDSTKNYEGNPTNHKRVFATDIG